MELARKNAKTFIAALIFLLLLLTEPRFSKFYSVAPDGKLSREIYSAIRDILRASPQLMGDGALMHFRIMRDEIRCLATDSEYIPLNYSNDKLDGKLPNGFLVDEVGALPNSYAIEAMLSGQLMIHNKFGCIVSTKYPTIDNPFEEELLYSKRVLDDIQQDETLFSLLYEPDNTKDWMTDDDIMRQANPLAICLPEVWNDLLKKRERAISMPGARSNFLCKHCNILYQSTEESFIAISDLRRGRLESIDWKGRNVFLGLDLAMTEDNCAYAMVAEDGDGGVLAEARAFIPADKIDEKSETEKFDYRRAINDGECYECGGRAVDYSFIEEVIMEVEAEYGVHVIGIGYDRWNCMATAQRLETAGYETTMVEQNSRTLHSPTKLLSELIAEGKFFYTGNRMLEVNFQNARCTYDTRMNRYVNKKRSAGKIDMVMALITAMYLLEQERLNGGDWIVQCV